MKKLVSVLLALSVALSAAGTALAKENAEVLLDGAKQDFTVNVLEIDNNILVPIRPMLGLFGYDISWDAMRKRVTARTGLGSIKIQIGAAFAWLNDSEAYIMPTYARIFAGQTMVPVKFISDATGAAITYSESSNTLSVTGN